MKNLVCFGECMLEFSGTPFSTFQQGMGGDTLNTAVYAARSLGDAAVNVNYVTALGEDALSDGMAQRWHQERVKTSLVRRIPDRMPGLYLIELEPSGERRFHYWRSESAARFYFDADTTPLEEAVPTIDAFYFSGIGLAILSPTARERLMQVARNVRKKGGLVAFDNNYRARLWPSVKAAQDAFAAAQSVANLSFVTLDDEQTLWNEPNSAVQLQRTLALPAEEMVIKRGAESTLIRLAGKEPVEVATTRVPTVVDTTAAGDSFAGGYLAARLKGASPELAAAAGNRLAARVIQHRGALIPIEAMADLIG